jgi:hypothetical protein
MPAPFVSGLELAQAYFTEVVRPLLDVAFPRLPYAAALLGWGSEVLGYDSAAFAGAAAVYIPVLALAAGAEARGQGGASSA